MENPLRINQQQLRELLAAHIIDGDNVAAISLQSPIYLMQDNGMDVVPTLHYKFEDSKVVWVNPLVLSDGNKVFSCSRIFVFGSEDANDLLATARHFAGLVSLLTHLTSLFEADRMTDVTGNLFNLIEKSQADFVLDSYVFISNGYPIGQILDVACDPNQPLDNEAKLSIAHLYEAAGSLSPYWIYLCYWKVLEVLYSNNGGKSALKNFINSCEPLNHNQEEWRDKYPDTYKRLYGTRNSISHWQNDREPDIKDPSNELLRERVEEDLPILLSFMRFSLNPKFGLTAY